MGNSFGKNQPEHASDDSMDVDHQPHHETVGNGMHELTAAQSEDVLSIEQSFELLEDGSRRNSRGTHEKTCEMCGEWIDLGRTLSGDASLVSHEGSKRCLARVEMEIQKRVMQDAAEIRKNVLASPHTPFHVRVSSPMQRIPLSPLSFVQGSSSPM